MKTPAFFGLVVGGAAIAGAIAIACATNDTSPNDRGFDDDAGCGAPRVICSLACVDVRSDTNNCGSCGAVCPPGDVCAGGRCGQTCPADQAACSGACVMLASDPTNCGRCGVVCDQGRSCVAGSCACPAGQTRCGEACVDTKTDSQNCGACETSCERGLACKDGSCGACGPGRTFCVSEADPNGIWPAGIKYCVDTMNSPSDCGGCGAACADGKVCTAGKCGCGPLETECNGACFDTKVDKQHCGSCTKTCTTSCSDGGCL